MKGFLHNIVSNQLQQKPVIYPRLKGRFESFVPNFSNSPGDINELHTEKDAIVNNEPLNKNKPEASNQPAKNFYDLNKNEIDNRVNLPSENYLNHELHLKQSFQVNQQDESSSSTKKDNSIIQNPEGLNIEKRANFNNDVQPVFNSVKTGDKNSENFLLTPDKKFPDNDNETENFSSPHSTQLNAPLQFNAALIKALSQQVKSDNLSIAEKESAKIIKVNIGRIDVRAMNQQTPVRESSKPKQHTSFDDFLKQKGRNK